LTSSNHKRRILLFSTALAVLSAGAWLAFELKGAPTLVASKPPPAVSPQTLADAQPRFVGSEACAGCHAKEHAAWKTSDHRRAMEPANAQTVLGDFGDKDFAYYGRATRFAKSDDKFLVTTDNERGEQQTFEIAYTLGVDPLQQYLVAFDDGRLQALPFAWDTRPAEAGGQRWFHLYPDEDVTPKSPLFWTRAQQNWNHMCGECHTTDFDKGFSSATGRWNTTFNELGNGCESCHGAGSTHVQVNQQLKAHPERVLADDSLLALRDQATQLDQCGVCHARRVRLSEPVAGRERMHQTWRPELLQDGLYFVDGQIRDEVFEVGSFLQSKMAGHGVACTSCHDPHAGKLKLEGNALCTQCHDKRYDAEQHYFHATGTEGAQCVSCHMPERTYMVVDDRRDHRFAVPRPDLSDVLGTPQACASCHEDKSNSWAAEAIRKRRAPSEPAPAQVTLGTVQWQLQHEQSEALASLSALLAEPVVSPIAKASALAAVGGRASREALQAIAPQLRAPDPWLRFGAALALSRAGQPVQPSVLDELARDDARSVRMAIAPLLARAHGSALIAEYRRFLAADADRADALIALANLERAAGNREAAGTALETAMQRDETSLIAHLNLADHQRGARDDAKAEALLRKAALLYPESADVHHALGLLLVRKREPARGVLELRRAAELAPDNSHYAYVYAVGLYSTQQVDRALSTLAAARRRFPQNEQVRSALQTYCEQQPKAAFRASCGRN
jgi:predicted CXXCH cytochrome family protein